MGRYKLAIFDLDGTILYTIAQLANSLNEARVRSGLEPQDMDDIMAHVGRGVRNLVTWSIGTGEGPLFETVMDNYRSYYNEFCADNTYIYDGLLEVITKLHDEGIKLAVVTNKSDAPAKKLCEHFYPGLFSEVRGHRDGVPHKPDPALVNEVLKALNIKPEDAVYIGDSDVDVKTAKNSGMDHICVTWGYRTREFLIENGAEVLVDTAEELGQQILLHP